jgi:hypothetical protein
MASINIAGDTSGVVTLQAPSVAGSTTLNLPATSGTVLTQNPSAPADSFVVNASGNVGIGTSSPTAKLQVNGAASITSFTGTTGLGIKVLGSTSATDYSGIDFTGNNQSNPTARIAVVSGSFGSSLQFGTSNAYASGITNTALTIDSVANLQIGTTGGSSKINTFVSASQVGYSQNKPSTGDADHQQFFTDGTLFAKMTNRGSWYNFDNVYGSLSDETVKENIIDATSKLDDLMQVKVRNYNFIADDSKTKQLGVIAQEVEQIFPSIVDVDSDGLKSVKYSVFVPMILKAIQELNAKVEAQAEQIKALQGAA